MSNPKMSILQTLAGGHTLPLDNRLEMQLAASAVPVDVVAHHLALINRFGGATVRPYSVAEHSLLVVEIMQRELGIRRPDWLMLGLLHDAHESMVGDVTEPIKRAMRADTAQDMDLEDWAALHHLRYHETPATPAPRRSVYSSYDRLEQRAQAGLMKAAGVSRLADNADIAKAVHLADTLAAATEWRDVVAHACRYYDTPATPIPPMGEETPQPVSWINVNATERAAMAWTDWRDRWLDEYAALAAACIGMSEHDERIELGRVAH